MIEFYDNDMSVCAQKVRLVLAEKQLEFQRYAMNLRAGDQFRPEYLRLNPNAVVPTLVDNGNVILESTVICYYLEDAYPKPALQPASPVGRAIVRYWTMRPDTGLHDACGVTSFALAFREQLSHLAEDELTEFFSNIPNERRRTNVENMVRHGLNARGVAEALRVYKTTIDAMETRLQESDWLAADFLTLADIAMLPYVLRLEQLGLQWFWRQDGHVANWLSRYKQRATFSSISGFLDQGYLTLMSSISTDRHERVRELLTS